MAHEISYVVLQLVDLLGQLKGVIVPCSPVESLDDLQDDPVLSAGSSVDGSSIVGLTSVESSDLHLRPDVDTLVELPFGLQRTAAVMCYVQRKADAADTYYHLDTRGVLQTAYDRLLPGELHLRVKTEPEFFFLDSEGDLLDEGQYADIYPDAPGQDTLLEIASAVREMGIRVRVAHHEVGVAQHEIELSSDDARRMADSFVRFKQVARAIAQENGLDVTFMPKPIADIAGSGLHCHLQLWEGDTNLFGGDRPGELSETAKHFIAGIIEHARAITAISNPTVNSYKRLVPHHEAPVYICWGYRNRTALIRVPLFAGPDKAAIEFRSPDPLTNPYLLFAALIAVGMDGVKRNLEPPPAVNDNVFTMNETERQRLGIGVLPKNLGEALEELKMDTVLRDALGEELVRVFIDIKSREWEEYVNRAVTDWEWEKYLSA